MKTGGAGDGGSAIACLIKVTRPTRHSARKASIDSSMSARYMLAAIQSKVASGFCFPALVLSTQCFRKATEPFAYSHSRVAITLPPAAEGFRIHVGAHVLYPGGDPRSTGLQLFFHRHLRCRSNKCLGN